MKLSYRKLEREEGKKETKKLRRRRKFCESENDYEKFRLKGCETDTFLNF